MAYTTINNPTIYFNTKLYTGTGSSNALTGVGFQPDWVWIKRRSATANHRTLDSVRGSTKEIYPNLTNSEQTFTGISSFNSDGFTLATADGSYNLNSATYVAWNWKGGGAASSNSNGSITSSVSANTSAGFSIVSYTGTGSTATVGHGLGVAPDVIIVKNREDSNSWNVYHVGNAGATPAEDFVIYLDQTTAKTNQASNWNDTAPTSSVFTVGSSNGSNGSSDDMIAYCFSAVEGYSKFGSYKGNGLSSGTFVFTGFRPAWVLVKNISTAYSWDLNDNKRDPHNVCEKVLSPNLSDAEATATSMDFLSNGFKLRVNNNSQNRSGDTFIYLAFAESPFKYSRAR